MKKWSSKMAGFPELLFQHLHHSSLSNPLAPLHLYEACIFIHGLTVMYMLYSERCNLTSRFANRGHVSGVLMTYANNRGGTE